MRSLVKQVQDVWFCTVTEENVGFDRKPRYSKPIKKRMSVSWGTGDMQYLGDGINEDYDRQILSFDRDFEVTVGTEVFVDTVPLLDIVNKELVLEDDGITPKTKPDYKVVKIIDTDKGFNARYCVKKV